MSCHFCADNKGETLELRVRLNPEEDLMNIHVCQDCYFEYIDESLIEGVGQCAN